MLPWTAPRASTGIKRRFDKQIVYFPEWEGRWVFCFHSSRWAAASAEPLTWRRTRCVNGAHRETPSQYIATPYMLLFTFMFFSFCYIALSAFDAVTVNFLVCGANKWFLFYRNNKSRGVPQAYVLGPLMFHFKWTRTRCYHWCQIVPGIQLNVMTISKM